MKKIKLSQGQKAVVNDDLFKFLSQWKWYAHWDKRTKSYYAIRKIGPAILRKTIKMERVVANTPDGKITDHRNHNTLDNRRENLRNVTQSRNRMNSRNHSDGSVGEKNIFPSRNGFCVRFRNKHGKTIFRQQCGTLEESIEIRNKIQEKLQGEFGYKKTDDYAVSSNNNEIVEV